MKKIGLYAGSFDPFTLGHLSIALKALSEGYDEVIIGVGINPAKKGLFDIEKRADLAKMTISDFIESYEKRHINHKEFHGYEIEAINKIKKNPNIIRTLSYDDLTIDCAIRNGATNLIRGERDFEDTAEEIRLEKMNNALAEVRGVNIKTDRIATPKDGLSIVSSSACKILCHCGEYIAAQRFVSPKVHNEMLKQKQYNGKDIFLYKEFKELGQYFELEAKEIDIQFNKLVKHYSEDREHHNLSHVAYGLNYIKILDNELRKNGGKGIENIQALKTAVFFHDIVNKGNKNDEELSAKMSDIFMKKAPQKDRNLVKKYIMATNHNEDTSSNKLSIEEKIIMDVDLAIFGDSKNFGTYSQNIRKEYSQFDDILFAKGRVNVLNKFIKKENIYKTKYFKETFSQKAKDNLLKERGHWLGVINDNENLHIGIRKERND